MDINELKRERDALKRQLKGLQPHLNPTHEPLQANLQSKLAMVGKQIEVLRRQRHPSTCATGTPA